MKDRALGGDWKLDFFPQNLALQPYLKFSEFWKWLYINTYAKENENLQGRIFANEENVEFGLFEKFYKS